MDTHEPRHSTVSRVLAWIAVIVWAVLIFVASAKSGLDFDTGNGPLELARRWLADALFSLMGHPVDPSPIGHFSEYLVFGALVFNALRMHLHTRLSRVSLCAIAIAAAYAVTDEFHQVFVPGRECDPADWIIDVAAAAIAACVFAAALSNCKRL